jgi:hypothetical protein
MTLQKTYKITGNLYNRYEIIRDGEGNEVKTIHIGLDDGGSGTFEKTLETIVPEIGDTQKVQITFKILSN